ncbi:hypothetical protein LIER_02970 [Lithospermum erythrorhizon]|uniref:Tyrosine-specific transport protein n=1 Tax=Lithospermum erythrorhizon TaxID=34254 RepID=A0AAV3NU75_LITER
MEINCIIPSSTLHNVRICRITNKNLVWPTCSYSQRILVCFKSRTIHLKEDKNGSYKNGSCWKISAKEPKNDSFLELKEEAISNSSKKEGSVAGAVALIIGTSIGSGILALPKITSPAGVIPSSISMILCWAFLLIEALLLVEINLGLLKRKKKTNVDKDELEIISIRTMAEETLGEWGGGFATVTYVFLGYTSMTAYVSKSGEILCHLINLPESVSGALFTVLFTILITACGTQVIAQVNQWLTTTMLGFLVAIEVLAISFGGWTGLGGDGDWQKVPATLPVVIFSLVYHDLAPVLCAYLGGDLQRLRTSVVVGSTVPLLALLLWDSIILGLPAAQSDKVIDPFELLMRVSWSGVPFMVEAFALLAIGTSLIGTLLSFSEFFKEQINNLLLNLPKENVVEKTVLQNGPGKWFRRRVGFTSMAIVVAPALFISSTLPDAFSTATDIAGGYCMTMLYGVLPPAMAWAVCNKEEENPDQIMISSARPALIGVGLFACLIIAEQILQDLSKL